MIYVEKAEYFAEKFWGDHELQGAGTYGVRVVATLRRRGHEYHTMIRLFRGVKEPVVVFSMELPEALYGSRRKDLRAEILSTLKTLGTVYLDTVEYALKRVEFERGELSRGVLYRENDLRACADKHAKAKGKLAAARRKLKSFNKKHPETPREEIPF